jgi:hypothetical protein
MNSTPLPIKAQQPGAQQLDAGGLVARTKA